MSEQWCIQGRFMVPDGLWETVAGPFDADRADDLADKWTQKAERQGRNIEYRAIPISEEEKAP